MAGRRLSAWLASVALAGCAVAEYPYPLAWDPVVTPGRGDCKLFLGFYGDQGERGDEYRPPSLAHELFGDHADWEKAKRVQFAQPLPGLLDITVWDEVQPLFSRTFSESDGDYGCKQGRLYIRNNRWQAGYVMSGRQNVSLLLYDGGKYLVAEVDELTYGLMFFLFPVAGSAKHWYRFPRLSS